MRNLPLAIITSILLIDNDSDSIPILPLDGCIYTPTLLVDLATPDLPYNVIIFTCSSIAFIFGSILSLWWCNGIGTDIGFFPKSFDIIK